MKQKILLVDDDTDILSALKMLLISEGFEVALNQTPEEALISIKKENFDLILMDLNYSLDTTSGEEGLQLIASIRKLDELLPIVVMTGWATIEVAVSTMQNGANDFIQKPWDIDRLIAIINNQIKLAQSEKNSQKLSQQNQLLQQQVDSEFSGELVASSPKMQQTLAIIEQVAKSDASVLLTGENGTGKSMFARYIHAQSNRSNANQISVNMGAVTETLFESEMFGHTKGAFTDAKTTRIGRFELADGGTLFLDEIANTPYSQQGKLLRVLEDSEFEKVGGNKTQSVDIRLISATNANLSLAVENNAFRKDLLYRINTITIEIPALKDRKEDIILLADSFLTKMALKHHKPKLIISKLAQQALLDYTWPGNIRELNHVMERAQILCQNNEISVDELGLPELTKNNNKISNTQTDNESQELATLETLEMNIIDKRLTHFDGNVLKAAKSLGLSRSAFYRRLEKM
ncbi:sigma-54-dependent transcriptional regulator [Pseudoalteromonas denitrificans]|uniref:DNA-binding transcriptional response regulator, NtrC family, contains REC, AAA-type ATPase, and a Fis-type DNA-binding domains n=1 Tax=Pseudoalteromonas denitrificans DSM 6059 TaxID=1123010 RepID=A0A1I1T280_9GAMM|nr:sigma-54 dependent transcriptional regulator [Pseudoalteromonas denitrificans]SFD52794.1 DNA-binding transcriptional response regulator, NtrC family, contains REC, AAA-type ATPase, and a Fis-type DNA-binding domains [Pseudoalteromonas denitrificans DSM 6059]